MARDERKMDIHNYTVIFESLGEDGCDVLVPVIPEICTFGEIRKEAREMLEDAMKCYLESPLERVIPGGQE